MEGGRKNKLKELVVTTYVITAIVAICIAWFSYTKLPMMVVTSSLCGLGAITFLISSISKAIKRVIESEYKANDLALEAQGRSINDRNMLDGLADGLDVWILLLDNRGTIRYANQKAIEALGIKDAVGQSILAVTLSRELADLVASTTDSEPSHMTEVVLRHPRERNVMARVWSATTQNDQFFVSIYDVTDLRRLERARRDFVANVSHELRTPMATIRAMAETILDDPEEISGDTEKYLNRIVTEVDRLTRISDDLLTLSAAESKPKPKEPVRLSQIVVGAVNQVRPKAQRKGLALLTNDFPDVTVMGDAEALIQVMLNLLENAVNYTSEGHVKVDVDVEGDCAKVTVSDTGMGIPSDHIDRIFERFYRVDKARSRATGGTGLGLSIVRNIVDSHHGTVGVDSVLSQGSSFWVYLPIMETE